jgi:hypothetical protein
VAALRLNALGNDDTLAADLVRRKRHQVYGESGRHRLDVSNETYKIVWGLVQDENESESPVAQRGTERLRELGGVDALFLRRLVNDIEQAAPSEVFRQYLPLELLSRDAVQRSSVGKHLRHDRPPRLCVVPSLDLDDDRPAVWFDGE